MGHSSDADDVFEETRVLEPPIVSFVFSPGEILVNEEIEFDASESHAIDGDIASYRWDFGDGTTSTGQLVTHTYIEPGEYVVTLAVVDNDGAASANSKLIEVGDRRDRREVPAWVSSIIAITTILVLGVTVLIFRKRQWQGGRF